jgi:hypothetical protein
MLDRPPGQPSTAPHQPPAGQPCARCDGPVEPPWACCDRCVKAANRAIAAHPGQVVTPAMIEAARREMDNA